jgi:hypothetical protein
MNVTALVVALVVLVAIVAVAAWLYTREQRRRQQLRERFGPEYDRTVAAYGERRPAEDALSARAERVAKFQLHPLSESESARYAEQWRAVQSRFVDDPEHAIGEADQLCTDVMQARGYPMADFEQRAADISVDHADVVDHYRTAHAIATRANRGEATTEDLRQAMVHYRALFQDLIEVREPARVERP